MNLVYAGVFSLVNDILFPKLVWVNLHLLIILRPSLPRWEWLCLLSIVMALAVGVVENWLLQSILTT